MGFDPDKYLAQKQNAGGFDPDSYLAAIEKPEPISNPVESALMHGLQGASGGFLDEGAGLVEGAGRAVGLKGLGGSLSDIEPSPDGPTLDWETLRDAYKDARDKKRGVLKKQSEENPFSSGAGTLAGMIGSPLNKLAAGASLAKGGSLLGGINALGGSDAERPEDLARDTAVGMTFGGVLGKGAEKATPLLKAGAEKLSSGADDMANWFGGKALGAERGTIKSLGPEKVKAAGKYARENDLLDFNLSTEEMIAKNLSNKSKGGEMMGEAYQAIDDAGASTFNPLDAATAVDDKIGGFFRSPINRGEANQLENTLDSILMRGDKNIPLKEAQKLKEELGKVANWKNKISITEKEKMARDSYKVVSSQIDEAVSRGASEIEQAGLSDTLAQGKDLFSKASTSQTLLENKLAREQGNKFISLTDTISGGAALGYGGMTSDWETAGGLMLAKKGLEKYGAKAASRGLGKVSEFLMKSPQMAQLLEKNPQAFQSLATKLEEKMGMMSAPLMPKAEEQESSAPTMGAPDKTALIEKTQGTKYGQVLQNAAQKGDASFNAAHYVLSQRDPEYRKALKGGER